MDTTEKYIKMCDCSDIQDGHVWEEGDYHMLFWTKGENIGNIGLTEPNIVTGDDLVGNVESSLTMSDMKKAVWLPRQDQLQEMVDWQDYSYVVSTMCYQIDEFYSKLDNRPDSMEQLWLAFVMHKKYGKKWLQRKTGPGGQLMNWPHGEWASN